MADSRKSALAAMSDLGWKTADLLRVLEAAGKTVPKATVYQFLQGRSKINHGYLDQIMTVLERDWKKIRKK